MTNNVPNCELCLSKINIPLELTCHHKFCYLCIKMNMIMTSSLACPICHYQIIVDIDNFKISTHELIDNNSNIIWAYSSNYNNLWWCYDTVSIRKLELIYNDYIKRMQGTNNENENSTPDDIKIKIVNKNSVSSSQSHYSNYEFEKMIIQNNHDNEVNFESMNENDSEINEPEIEITYIVKIGHLNYQINIEEMKQINIMDPWKKRNIKRILLINDIDHMMNYLKNTHNIIGVAGIKFEK
jgi:Zinc finger, C3HC4 type (RING finger)